MRRGVDEFSCSRLRHCAKVLRADTWGGELTEYAKNVVKDDGRGLEAGILLQMEDAENKDMAIWGNIISELFHRRRAFRRVLTPLIGAEYVDIISAGMNQTANSRTTHVEFHVY